MAPVVSRVLSHEAENTRSYEVLQAAREVTRVAHGYSSVAVRSKMTRIFEERMDGKSPHPWQLDVAEALLLGLDCTVIAGTGCGKTMPFVMPTFVEDKKIYFVISPLNALEADQVLRFANLKVPAAAVNGETYKESLLEEIEQGKYRIVLTSPEMTEHPKFRELISKPKFAVRIGAFIIDEAHCITQWGKDFREHYDRLEELRALVPCPVPVLATSATFTPLALDLTRSKLGIRAHCSFHLNLGNDRANIVQEMRYMRSATDYAAVDFIVEGAQTKTDLPRTIIFVNAIPKSHAVAHRLREVVGDALRDQIGILHAKRSDFTRADEWELFRIGQIRILVATEAAAMGMDVPDITLAVQFGVPENLGIWLQRAGRAGRSAAIQARAVMLVEKSVVQRVGGDSRKSNTPNEVADEASDSEFEEVEEELAREEPKVKYKKEIEDSLRRWIETEGCRRAVADAYFDNPPHPSSHPPLLCCDKCAAQARSLSLPTAPLMTVTTTGLSNSGQALVTSDINDTAVGLPNEAEETLAQADGEDGVDEDINGKSQSGQDEENIPPASVPQTPSRRPARQGRISPKRRAGDHLKSVQKALHEWRLKTRRVRYRFTSIKAVNLLPEANLKTIASHRRGFKTVEHLRSLLKPAWPHLDAHGEEVLKIVKDLDAAEDARRRAATIAAREVRKAQTAQRHAQEAAAKQAARLQRQWAQSAASYAPPMQPSAALNTPHAAAPSMSCVTQFPYSYVYYYPPAPTPMPFMPVSPVWPPTPSPAATTTQTPNPTSSLARPSVYWSTSSSAIAQVPPSSSPPPLPAPDFCSSYNEDDS
ncbi:P-loop containing nucleoside triphosphate hydrolase protein [Daedaleopsis nitida]|nr:P-loop containing nucleoside triphosphate hydrolase protein [Daedaleopsis nitida]